MGNGMENLMERLEKELEEEKRERDKRNRWRKWLKILMILGVLLAFSVATILVFAKSLAAGFIVLGISSMFPYWLYEFYNEC